MTGMLKYPENSEGILLTKSICIYVYPNDSYIKLNTFQKNKCFTIKCTGAHKILCSEQYATSKIFKGSEITAYYKNVPIKNYFLKQLICKQ